MITPKAVHQAIQNPQSTSHVLRTITSTYRLLTELAIDAANHPQADNCVLSNLLIRYGANPKVARALSIRAAFVDVSIIDTIADVLSSNIFRWSEQEWQFVMEGVRFTIRVKGLHKHEHLSSLIYTEAESNYAPEKAEDCIIRPDFFDEEDKRNFEACLEREALKIKLSALESEEYHQEYIKRKKRAASYGDMYRGWASNDYADSPDYSDCSDYFDFVDEVEEPFDDSWDNGDM